MNNANIFQDFFVLSEKWCEIWSTIIDNWQQLFWGGQQLSTITNNLREVRWSTIIDN
jgi:hypothetical protein